MPHDLSKRAAYERMARRLVALLLVVAGAVIPTKGPADRRLVERAAAIDVWFQQHSREYRATHKGGKAFTPPTWTVRKACLLYTSPSPRDQRGSRMPSSA